MQDAYIPFRAWWSSPFCKWQGSIGQMHSVKLAAETAKVALQRRSIAPEALEGIVLGLTVHQKRSFYGAPWVSGMLGAPGITGPTVSQACATGARAIVTAAHEVASGQGGNVLVVTCDRTSNGPHVYYPDPTGPGGRGEGEDPVWDNFGFDPYGKTSMLQTAENVAKEVGITREEQDEIALLRSQQYHDALADDRAFQRPWMVPIELKRGRRVVGAVDADEGVFPSTAEGLAKLRPALEGGTVTFGSQTHPADGNAGLIVCNKDQAEQLAPDAPLKVRVLGYGEARVKPAFMPMAVVPAARDALERSGVALQDIAAIKTHNPFAVNDVFFCRELDLQPENVNRYGSPLVWGHPQGPTGTRAVIELIEELAMRGGGRGLFSGCAAGDSAMALVIEVG